MQQEKNKRRLIGLGIAIGLHLVFIALLYWLKLEGRMPLPKQTELVLIDLGLVKQSSGEQEPMGQEASGAPEAPIPMEPAPKPVQPAPRPTPSPAKPKPTTRVNKPTPAKPIQTQQHEESLRVAETRRRAEQANREAEAEVQRRAEVQRQIDEARRAEEEAERQRKAEQAEAQRRAEQARQAGSRVSNAFGVGRNTGQNQGSTASGAGNQGHPSGSSGSFSLIGRTIVSNGGRLNTPRTARAIRGRINVRITVDASGRVTEAHVDPRGTNIAEPAIRSAAVAAAKSTRFNTQEGAEEQRGIITYDFEIE